MAHTSVPAGACPTLSYCALEYMEYTEVETKLDGVATLVAVPPPMEHHHKAKFTHLQSSTTLHCRTFGINDARESMDSFLVP